MNKPNFDVVWLSFIPPDYKIMCCLIVNAMSPVSLTLSVVLRSWKPFRPPLKVRGGLWKTLVKQGWGEGVESFSMSSSLRFFFFNCLGPKPAPQLELVCGALLSHSHLMENICCHAFYYSQQRYVCLCEGGWGGRCGIEGGGEELVRWNKLQARNEDSVMV